MASHQIQFQQGMSIPEFLARFGSEAQCVEGVLATRWPTGFYCARCDSNAHYVVGHGVRKLFQRNGCRHQSSLTAGSLREHAKLPLKAWFLAIYCHSQAKTGLSAPALKRQLGGVSYQTAWLLRHKINAAMAQRDSTLRLSGTVQLDDALTSMAPALVASPVGAPKTRCLSWLLSRSTSKDDRCISRSTWRVASRSIRSASVLRQAWHRTRA